MGIEFGSSDYQVFKQEFYKKLGIKLKEVREYRNLTQEELAQESGFSRVAISNFETGKHHMSLYTLIEICKILNVEIYEFV